MIDFHTHILPGIDDGSRDSKMTMEMLRAEKAQGVTLIAATPHFYADQMSVDSFLRRREDALSRTNRHRAESGEELPELVCGAEVYYFPGIGRAEAIPRLCIQGTQTLLLEMPFAQWDDTVYGDVRALIEKQGLHLVLAHIERYIDFQKKMDTWNRVMALDLRKQINAGSFLASGGLLDRMRQNRKRKFCLDYLAEHPETLIGTDCHNLTSRRPNLAEARKEIAQALGEDRVKQLDRMVATVLERGESHE